MRRFPFRDVILAELPFPKVVEGRCAGPARLDIMEGPCLVVAYLGPELSFD